MYMSGVQYVEPDWDVMTDFFDEHYTWEEVDVPNTNERVVEMSLPDEDLVIRVYTTINKSDNSGRGNGADAIRNVVWHTEKERPVGGREYTKRIRTDRDPHRYLQNLDKKVRWLYQNWKIYQTNLVCDDCGGDLHSHESEYGEFLSCENCDFTSDIPEKACPECGCGMHQSESQYGEYLWCENDQCHYTEDA
jgi:hypothetical protein